MERASLPLRRPLLRALSPALVSTRESPALMKRLLSLSLFGLLSGSLLGAQTGSVIDDQKVSDSFGNFTGGLKDNDLFGAALASPGDLDGDGIADLYVGMPGGDRGGNNAGAFWAVYMNADGTVKGQFRINEGRGGFMGPLDYTDAFGSSIACLGDVDGDGIGDLAVGVPGDDGGPFSCAGLVLSCNYGGYWILFMNEDGTVRDATPNRLDANFGSGLSLFSESGLSLAPLGDLNSDGVPDLAMGAPGSSNHTGALWIIYNNADGTPGLKLRLTGGQFGFDAVLGTANFGYSVANIGDMDGDGVVDLAVGAPTDSIQNRGAIYVLFLNADGTVKDNQKINGSEGGFGGTLNNGDRFGSSVTCMGDLNGDGVSDLAVGAELSDVGGGAAGAVWILFMNADGTVADQLQIGEGVGGLTANIRPNERFGSAVVPIPDLNGDGIADLVVGASNNDDGDGEVGESRGAFYVLFLDGMANMDFEGGQNGQQVGGGASISSVMSIEGFPSSGLTAALFDSDPAGPNAFSLDPDLLVDSGNILILQGVPGQTTPGIYDQPDDDRFGGTFVIDFGAMKVAPLSIDLIDLCPAPGQDATVTLFDDSGRTRTYSIPAGWTEDIQMDGPPGIRTLDLTTLADQPGYLAVATASQEARFDENAVVLLEIALGGSGAIDNLSYDPSPPQPTPIRDGSKVRSRSGAPGNSVERSLR